MAAGAGVAMDDILLLNCLPPNFYTPGQNCTGFLYAGKEENQLFKIRDERNLAQAFFITGARGRPRMQVAHDIGNLGFAHFFTAHALAGANHTGSPTNRVPDKPSLDSCHIMRYVAERAASVADIPLLYERLMAMGAAGGAAAGRGAIYTFVDAHQGLILETVSDAYAATFFERGIHVLSNHFLSAQARRWASAPPGKGTLLRRRRMAELLKRCPNPPRPNDVYAISRDRKDLPNSLCNDDRKHFWMTISAQLQVIPRRRPGESVNHVCCGNTRHSLYLPVALAETRSYLPLLDGSFYRAADRLYARNKPLTKVQKSFEATQATTGRDDRRYAQALRLIRSA